MPEHDPNGAARRPVLKRMDWTPGEEFAEWLAAEARGGRLWLYCGHVDAKGGVTGAEVAADLAANQHGSGVYTVFDAGSWGRGYWRG